MDQGNGPHLLSWLEESFAANAPSLTDALANADFTVYAKHLFLPLGHGQDLVNAVVKDRLSQLPRVEFGDGTSLDQIRYYLAKWLGTDGVKRVMDLLVVNNVPITAVTLGNIANFIFVGLSMTMSLFSFHFYFHSFHFSQLLLFFSKPFLFLSCSFF